MAGERRDKLAYFLGVNLEGEGEEGEDRVAQSFGKTDPWRQCKNGLNGILDVLMAEDADLAVPDEEDCDLQVAGLLVGELVGRSSLGLVERTAIKTFVRLVRPGTKAEYEDGVKAAMSESGGLNAKENEVRERLALEITGMSAREAKALVFGMAVFIMVPSQDLDAMPYGMDPLSWKGFKGATLYGNGSFMDYRKAKADAVDLRARLKKVARMLRDGGYNLASATLTTFLDELGEITFEQGVPGYFLDYYNEYMDRHRCRGLIVSAPLDQDVLRSKVLGRRGGGSGGGGPGSGASGGASASAAELAALRLQLDEARLQRDEKDREHKRAESQAASLRDQLRRAKEPNPAGAPEARPNPKPGEGGAKCYECGSLDHFGQHCPKRALRLAEAGASGADAGKDKTA